MVSSQPRIASWRTSREPPGKGYPGYNSNSAIGALGLEDSTDLDIKVLLETCYAM